MILRNTIGMDPEMLERYNRAFLVAVADTQAVEVHNHMTEQEILDQISLHETNILVGEEANRFYVISLGGGSDPYFQIVNLAKVEIEASYMIYYKLESKLREL